MENLSKLAKIFLFLTLIFFGLWLGSYTTRLILTFQLFHGTHFEVKDFVTNSNFGGILFSLAPAIATSIVAFLLLNVSYLGFLATSKLKMKLNGWLFIATVLICTVLPLELYLMIRFDKPFLDTAFYGLADKQYFIQSIIQRFKILGSFPFIEIFAYVAIAFLFLFRPLQKKVQ